MLVYCSLVLGLFFASSISADAAEGQLLGCTNATFYNQPQTRCRQSSANGNFTKVRLLRRDGKQHQINASKELCKTSNNEIAKNQPVDPLVVCTPVTGSLIEVFIRTVPDVNTTRVDHGTSIVLECRFNTLSSSNRSEFSFKLKWLRSVLGSPRVNQSIPHEGAPNLSSAEPNKAFRLWTLQRSGGLDLIINDFQSSDEGSYFCQAVASSSKELSIDGKIISEARLQLTGALKSTQLAITDTLEEDAEFSQNNLSNLLPSLKLLPEFSELSLGEPTQLACVTTHLDADPDPSEIGWSFDPIGCRSRRLDLLTEVTESKQLPLGVSVLDNILMIWSMAEEHCGIYKCTYHLFESSNVSSQASAEITLRPATNSAPLVFVDPELVRLSPDGSTSLRCEATGYPPPDLTWYRVDHQQVNTSQQAAIDLSSNEDDGISFEQVPYKDTMFYCDQNKCSVSSQLDKRKSVQITGISLVHLNHARAHHQGQYVCRASNKHGSNQASAIVDVEFKEPPVVKIADEHKHQTIVLQDNSEFEMSNQQNVTFRCYSDSGRPQPRLRWLKAAKKVASTEHLSLNRIDEDLYDLARVSDATANVTLWSVDRGRGLMLALNTVSLDDEGEYICLGENEWGRHTEVAHLTVVKPARVRIQQQSPKVARVNESFHLDCLASGHPIPLDLEWSRMDRGAFFSMITRTPSNGLQIGQLRASLKFDRVTPGESGEYMCNARDPLNSSMIWRDTIMVLIEHPKNGIDTSISSVSARAQHLAQFPKLMVRPTKASAVIGTNLTLDCLAVSGLQPTVVEWIAPSNASSTSNYQHQSSSVVWPYYRSMTATANSDENSVWQFGSKLRIMNVSKQNEGVYQCKGSNRLGTEIAPALIRVVDDILESSIQSIQINQNLDQSLKSDKPSEGVTMDDIALKHVKTKIARVGTNIELKCQVNGVQQPATSWSRDGLELPVTSVQIGHNMWIQNVSLTDSGLYICSARAAEPNKVVQAKINLLVSEAPGSSSLVPQNLSAKIVASKSVVNLGDSVTLECIIGTSSSTDTVSTTILDEIERNVIWTNLHSGQSVFQDNVYVQNNLLIIYDLKPENSAVYRCNYNDLTQHADYRLQVVGVNSPDDLMLTAQSVNDSQVRIGNQSLMVSNGRRAILRQVPLDAQLKLECPGGEASAYLVSGAGSASSGVFRSIKTNDADIYHCYGIKSNALLSSTIVQVLAPVARFAQRPVSFVTLPSISGADHQLELELKFLPEREHGLILFNGQFNSYMNRTGNISPGDYISLGMNRGYLEFRFELGDGTTLLRSQQSLSMNHWHRVRIERNRREAIMLVDKQQPVRNSSAGKFFELNLESVLYVGGHQQFADFKSTNRTSNSRFFGYSRGFQGCISLLRISRVNVDLMAQNRTAAIGIYECDKPECNSRECSGPKNVEGLAPMGVCQVDYRSHAVNLLAANGQQIESFANDLRCICLPGLGGDHCDRPVELPLPTHSITTTTIKTVVIPTTTIQPSIVQTPKNSACNQLATCSSNGTLACQSLTSIQYKCHCKLGFQGDTCAQPATFAGENSAGFNQQAYIQFRFNKLEEYIQQQGETTAINASMFSRMSSQAESQNISFNLLSTSNYGLIFYTGQAYSTLSETQQNNSVPLGPISQTSKSLVANMLARLSNIVFDHLAIALVDGHVELSYELGSGVAIIRSSQRVNDGSEHLIRVLRSGKAAKLIIDSTHTYEGSSPGKLSMLNTQPDIYLGGLPHLAEMTHNMYMSGFVGCLSNLEINSLGPINLLRSNHLTTLESARNLVPCGPSGNNQTSDSPQQMPITTTPTVVKYRPYTPTPPADSDDPDEM